MSVEAKHWYRFVYLNSEEWQSLRLESLVHHKAKCFVCGYESIRNDLHHVVYPNVLSDAKPHSLMVLCRRCHDLIHVAIEPKKKMAGARKWEEFHMAVRLIRRLCKIPESFSPETYLLPSVNKVKVSEPYSLYLCFICRNNAFVCHYFGTITTTHTHIFSRSKTLSFCESHYQKVLSELGPSCSGKHAAWWNKLKSMRQVHLKDIRKDYLTDNEVYVSSYLGLVLGPSEDRSNHVLPKLG